MTNLLLQTKIFPPRARPGFIERPRLARLLDNIDTVKMVLLSAPTGFGKSSLSSTVRALIELLTVRCTVQLMS